MNKYIGMWIDHRKATIVSLNRHTLETEPEEKESIITIESGVEKHLRLSGVTCVRAEP